MSFRFLIILCAACTLMRPALADDVLKIGSKRFTESYILGEILRETAAPHSRAEHRQGLGNTAIVFEALKSGSIDIYPEYLGTLDLEILKNPAPTGLAAINRALAPLGLGAAVPLGFNNGYALAIRAADASRLSAKNLSDLPRQGALRYGLSHEFIGRADGWPGLAQRYGIKTQPIGLEHALAYGALAQNQIDVIDIYSTDAKIKQYGLQVLADDTGYFPRYDAVLLYRLDIARRFPDAWRAIQALENRVNESDMIAMNAAAELDGRSFGEVAHGFLSRQGATGKTRAGLWDKLFDENMARLTRQHITLVLLAVALATLVGIPLGILAALVRPLRQAVMALVGVLQTIPSLALLAMLIPLLGSIGTLPALVALFLYALLPIVRNTGVGIAGVPPGLRMAALALGLTRRQTLIHVDLPLALPTILAGIKTAAIVSVGTATIAAFIGAGGYGERIAIGLATNDHQMLLAGAIPAAALALLTQLLFEGIERLLQRRHPV